MLYTTLRSICILSEKQYTLSMFYFTVKKLDIFFFILLIITIFAYLSTVIKALYKDPV